MIYKSEIIKENNQLKRQVKELKKEAMWKKRFYVLVQAVNNHEKQ